MLISAYVPNGTKRGEVVVNWSLTQEEITTLQSQEKAGGMWVLFILATRWFNRSATRQRWFEIERRVERISSSGPRPILFQTTLLGEYAVIGLVIYATDQTMGSPKKWLMAKPSYTDGEYRDLLVEDDWSGKPDDNPLRSGYREGIFDSFGGFCSEKWWRYPAKPAVKLVEVTANDFVTPTWDWKLLHLVQDSRTVRTPADLWRRRLFCWLGLPIAGLLALVCLFAFLFLVCYILIYYWVVVVGAILGGILVLFFEWVWGYARTKAAEIQNRRTKKHLLRYKK
ncbi:MAG: hypothetical protein A2571_01980 [Candidatus Vogelbacteria bacterium RIFOXYD1_FULL_44_32]|uniref:Uncharacterized protein n=1 Tax=Candidatus Vogelbacteria bacterium RIFOXYD1_FULL_44_32 TaxID=1802438 RepID=A0A1G2QEU3_9BACT|nr:MAG: hypothetical protein A2571_01980 [Candidatus Vogelbacteria bacterium RIFOXYD1_FULL_44_32]